ncbi:hypothetical protein WJX81_005441 [Elliptochloris bilobata]|uniref:RING-type E3 ubiquitin transferase n=1 Tax=Elliptochloris bilobata TaxID=381761 RepID=A0AAW1QZ78_9CHLO
MKRQRQPLQATEAEERAAKRLAAHGEAFLSLFGDSATAPPTMPANQMNVSAVGAAAGPPESHEAGGSSDEEADGGATCSGVEEVVFQPRGRKGSGTPGSERRRFLSGAAERVHSSAALSAAPPTAGGPRGWNAEEQKDFEKMRQEVHMCGAAALDKRQRKAFEAARLQSLNARAEKAPRTVAAIGLGMAKKRTERERQAQEDAIDAGLLQRKGLGKKRRRAALAACTGARGGAAGLREDNGAFRGGVLRVHLAGDSLGGKRGGARSARSAGGPRKGKAASKESKKTMKLSETAGRKAAAKPKAAKKHHLILAEPAPQKAPTEELSMLHSSTATEAPPAAEQSALGPSSKPGVSGWKTRASDNLEWAQELFRRAKAGALGALHRSPVVTLCGHLYCWPCLYRWMQVQSHCRVCPVCKAGIEQDKVVPIYGRGGENTDPRQKLQASAKQDAEDEASVPRRPAGQRVEPVQRTQLLQPGNSNLQPGLGIIPTLFGLQHAPGQGGFPEPLTPEQQHQAFLSRLLLMLGSFVIMCLLLF